VKARATGADGTANAGSTADEANRFLRELRGLRHDAGLESAELAARAHYPLDAIAAAEAGPRLPELPVLSAYVRGCGGGLAEWEERWRSLTGAPGGGSRGLPSRPVGESSLAAAGARAASHTAIMGFDDGSRLLAAMSQPGPAVAHRLAGTHRAGPGTGTIPAQPRPAAARPGPAASPPAQASAMTTPDRVMRAGQAPAPATGAIRPAADSLGSSPAGPAQTRPEQRPAAARRQAAHSSRPGPAALPAAGGPLGPTGPARPAAPAAPAAPAVKAIAGLAAARRAQPGEVARLPRGGRLDGQGAVVAPASQALAPTEPTRLPARKQRAQLARRQPGRSATAVGAAMATVVLAVGAIIMMLLRKADLLARKH
jgi:hypothetical protein